MARVARGGVHAPREELMSDKATMLRETVEAFADLRTMFDGLTEEQASRVWLGVLGVRDTVIHIHRPATLRGNNDQTLQTAESTRIARNFWAPGSFWGLRHPSERDGERSPS
jgi:hypothetical protein